MIERVYTFGTNSCLVGIVTEPSIEGQNKDTPAIVLLNAGLLHRVGPYRINVNLARKLSKHGFFSLRFDLSGLGDSLKRKDDSLDQVRTIGDIREAIDFLSSKFKIDKFILIGICSGADNAHKCSVQDERVVGAVFIDGYRFPTFRTKLYFHLNRYVSFLIKPKKIVIFLKNIVLKYYRKFISKSIFHDSRADIYFWEMPLKQSVEADLKYLIQRKVNLLFIYTKDSYRTYNYKAQFQDMFNSIDFLGMAESKFFPESDHLFTLKKHKDELFTTICEWLLKNFKNLY